MRFCTIFSIGIFASATVASPAVRARDGLEMRATMDLSQAKTIFTAIINGIEKEVDLLNHWDDSTEKLEPIVQQSHLLLKTIEEGAATIGSPSFKSIGLMEIGGLAGAAAPLASAIDTIVRTLVNKREKFDKIGKTGVILEQLEKQQAGAEKLTKNLYTKITAPDMLAGAVKQYTESFVHQLDNGVSAFRKSSTPSKH